MDFETYEQAGQRHLNHLEGMPLKVEQRTQLAIACFLGGILQELGNIRENGGEVVSQINTINAWLHGNVDGRPEVIVHRAEDV